MTTIIKNEQVHQFEKNKENSNSCITNICLVIVV